MMKRREDIKSLSSWISYRTEESEEEERTFVLVVEAKRSTLAVAFRRLFLVLNDMWDTNGKKGVVYGFATTGEDWQMVTRWKVSTDG